MTRNDKAREAARSMQDGFIRYEFARLVRVPDYGEVQYAADVRAYVEALIEVPAEMLREDGKDA